MSGITRPRFHWEDHFTMVPNEWARDGRLGRRARGLLLELMSHEPGWVTSVQQLIDGGQEGKDAVRADLNALVEAGYLRRITAERARGRFAGVSWEVCDPFESGSPASPGSVQVADRGGSAAAVNPPPKKNTLKKNPLPPSGEAPPLAGTEPEAPKRKVRRKATSALPPDWSPRPVDREKAPPGVDVDIEASKFRDHAEANDRRQVDWHAAFRLWLRRAGEYAAARPPGGRSPGQDVDPAKGADAWMYPERRTTYADYAPAPEETP